MLHMKTFLMVVCMTGFFWTNSVAQSHVFGLWEQLLLSAGESDFPPQLVITEDASSGPAYYSKRQVFLHDSLLILMADGFEGDGMQELSYVLAHELAHHNSNHLVSHFTRKGLRGTEALAIARGAADREKNEAEADNLAGLYGHIANLNNLVHAEEVLDLVYGAYNIPDSIPGYPTLNQRKRIVVQTHAQLERVTLVYDAALFAVGLGLYESAIPLLESLLRDVKYTSFEVYDLLALAHFYWAIDQWDNKELRAWEYPIRMGSRSISEQLTRGGILGGEEWVLEQLQTARKWGRRGNDKRPKEIERSGIEASARFIESYIREDDFLKKGLDTFLEGLDDQESKLIFQALGSFLQGKPTKSQRVLLSSQFEIFGDVVKVNLATIAPHAHVLDLEKDASVECAELKSAKQEALLLAFNTFDRMKQVSFGSGTLLKYRSIEGGTQLDLKSGRTDQTLLVWSGGLGEALCSDFVFGETTKEETLRNFGSTLRLFQLSTSTMLYIEQQNLLLLFDMNDLLRYVIWKG